MALGLRRPVKCLALRAHRMLHQACLALVFVPTGAALAAA